MTDSTSRYFPPDRIGQIAVPVEDVDFVEAPRRIARMPDHDLWMAFLRDSEGNVIGLRARCGERTPRPPGSDDHACV